jgi:hypothetical protein
MEKWDLEEYPELKFDHIKHMQIWEDDQGFIHLDSLESPTDQG